ncbi:small GTPase LIP1-like isoform X2 [Curcuma longa]|uniref:small GTPase LIP1-like isoform X2 n=1 Tax=Curcuma longa TaxID=136217 RepID=UPI003D9F228B
MFWRQKERESSNWEYNSGPPLRQVRVLVVGDAGVGKTSVVHLILKGASISRPSQTVGCTVGVKHISYGSASSSSNSLNVDSQRDFFIELWDVSGHERYKDCRSLFYREINGVIFVHDLSQRRTKTNLQKWAAEIAANDRMRVSGGNLVDVARHWVEKQGFLPSSEELPLTDSFPGISGLLTAAKEARYDKEAVIKFFRVLIRRRYFSDEPPAPTPWPVSPLQNSLLQTANNSSDDDQLHRRLSFSSDDIKYNVPPLPLLNMAPTIHPQQPVSGPENYNLHRFSASSSPQTSSTKSYRPDIIF